MIQYQLLSGLIHLIVFFMGASIGSFLNVVIYRLPREMSVNNPKRSFCPSCKYQIPFYQNIPIVSWLLLKGRCANCGQPISPRYIGVEVLVGALFYAIFWHYSHGGDWRTIADWGPVVLCYWLFASLLVAGSFIDIEHFILPHEITIGGAVAGLICTAAVPDVIGEETHLRAFLTSLGSAALGLGGLWLVVELGKLAFGRKRYRFPTAEPWSVTQPDDTLPPILTIQDEPYNWVDLFVRRSDRLIIDCTDLRVNDASFGTVTAELWMEKLKVRDEGGKLHEFDLEAVTTLSGSTTQVVIPREAMGFGDVLLLMMIGAFLGWKAVIWTIFAASVLGALLAGVWRLLGRQEWSAKIPFGPYLAAGALMFLFWGAPIVEWYSRRINLPGSLAFLWPAA